MKQEKKQTKIKRRYNKNSFKFKILVVCLIVVFLLAGFVIYIARGGGGDELQSMFSFLHFGTKITEDASVIPVSLDTSGKYAFAQYKGDVVVCGLEDVQVIDEKGRQIFSVPGKFSQPMVYGGENAIAAASQGGSELLYIRGQDDYHTMQFEGELISFKLNKNDYLTAVAQQSGGRHCVYVYNPKGEALFKWQLGSDYVLDAALGSNNKSLAVSVLDINSEMTTSKINFFDISKDQSPSNTVVYEDALISHMQWYGSARLGCVSDHAFLMMDSKGGELAKYSFGGKSLREFNISKESHCVFALGDMDTVTGSGSDLVILDKRLQKQGEYHLNNELKNLEVMGNIYVTTAKELAVLDHSGNVHNMVKLPRDARSGNVFGSGEKMLTVSGLVAEIVSIR